MLGGSQLMVAEVEKIADPVVSGKETLRLSGPVRLVRSASSAVFGAGWAKPAKISATPPMECWRRVVRAFCPVADAFVLPVLDRAHHLALGRPVARRFVGDHDTRRSALPFQQLAQQAFGGPRVAPALRQDVQHPGPAKPRGVLIRRAPRFGEAERPLLHAHGRRHDLTHVPLVAGRRQLSPDLVREALPEFQRPLAPVDPLRGSTMADNVAARG